MHDDTESRASLRGGYAATSKWVAVRSDCSGNRRSSRAWHGAWMNTRVRRWLPARLLGIVMSDVAVAVTLIATSSDERLHDAQGSRRLMVGTRSIVRSKERISLTPVASACATRYASAKSRRSTS